MTYDPRCETIRFAWRKIRFVFGCFELRQRPKRKGPAAASGPLGLIGRPLNVGSAPRRGALRGRFAASQGEVGGSGIPAAKSCAKAHLSY
jgi:hypothetical protein